LGPTSVKAVRRTLMKLTPDGEYERSISRKTKKKMDYRRRRRRTPLKLLRKRVRERALKKESESVSFVQLLHWKKGSLYSGISSSSETAPLSVCVRVRERECVWQLPRCCCNSKSVWEGRGELRMRFSGKAIHPRRPHRKASCRLCNFEKRTLYLSHTHTPTLCLSLSHTHTRRHTRTHTHMRQAKRVRELGISLSHSSAMVFATE